MAQINKILKYQVQARILKLDGEGRPTQEIADIVTAELRAKGIDDSISQPTVHRHLQQLRAERAAESSRLVQDYNEITVPADIEVLEEIMAYFLMIFRNQKKDEQTGGMVVAGHDFNLRARAAMNLHQIIYTKWVKLGNIPPNKGDDKDGEPDIPKSPVSSGSKVHSILGRFRERT